MTQKERRVDVQRQLLFVFRHGAGKNGLTHVIEAPLRPGSVALCGFRPSRPGSWELSYGNRPCGPCIGEMTMDELRLLDFFAPRRELTAAEKRYAAKLVLHE